MKCQNCESEIPQGEFFCPICGAEVQLVQDYRNQVDYMLQEKELKEKEEQRRKEEEARKIEEERLKNRPKRWVIVLKIVLTLIGSVLLGYGIIVLISTQNNSSAAFQTNAAYTAFERGDYEDSRTYLSQALKLDETSYDLLLLNARLLLAEEKQEEAISALESLLIDYPNQEELYSLLISVYEEEKKTEDIVALIQSMPSDLQADYANYLVEAPAFSLESGSYEYGSRITISSNTENIVIYYTTDGTTPTSGSDRYQSELILPVGTTTFQAVAVNSYGISSEVTTAVFEVTLPVSDEASEDDEE